jgi:hypothetical protein
MQVDHAAQDIVALGVQRQDRGSPRGHSKHDHGAGVRTVAVRSGWRAAVFRPTAATQNAGGKTSPNMGDDGAIQPWHLEQAAQSTYVAVGGRAIGNNPELAIRAAVDELAIAYTAEAVVADSMSGFVLSHS